VRVDFDADGGDVDGGELDVKLGYPRGTLGCLLTTSLVRSLPVLPGTLCGPNSFVIAPFLSCLSRSSKC
jgi:hypothetical protein